MDVKFEIQQSAMNVQVKIFEDEKCVYKRETAKSDENDLRTLLQDLREVQSGINHFLTTLIQQRDASSGTQNTTEHLVSSDVESDFSEEEKKEEKETQVNPKKCKLSA